MKADTEYLVNAWYERGSVPNEESRAAPGFGAGVLRRLYGGELSGTAADIARAVREFGGPPDGWDFRLSVRPQFGDYRAHRPKEAGARPDAPGPGPWFIVGSVGDSAVGIGDGDYQFYEPLSVKYPDGATATEFAAEVEAHLLRCAPAGDFLFDWEEGKGSRAGFPTVRVFELMQPN